MRNFPRTEVAGISLPRMLMGTNWVLGYGHRTASADKLIKSAHDEYSKTFPLFEAYSAYGVDAVMGPISTHPYLEGAIKYAEDKLGKPIIRIDTPILNVQDSPQARHEAEQQIKLSAAQGNTFCLMHQASTDSLVNPLTHTIDRLDDYTRMMRDNGLIPGLSTHLPQSVTFSDEQGYDVETYIQLFNCMGFLMHTEIEDAIRVICGAKKPVMTIKPMAAGRVTPYVGLTFNWNVIRPQDMITLGAFNADEVHEDMEISFAAFDHRLPETK